MPENTCGENPKEEINNLKNSGTYDKCYKEKISNLKIYKDLLGKEIQNGSDEFNALLVVLANKEGYSNDLLIGDNVSLGILHYMVNDFVCIDQSSTDSIVTCSCVEIRGNCLKDLFKNYISVDNKIIKVHNDWVDENSFYRLDNTFRQKIKKKHRNKEKKENKKIEKGSERNKKRKIENSHYFKQINRIYVHPKNIQSLFEIFSKFSTEEEGEVFYRIIEFHIESSTVNEWKEVVFYKDENTLKSVHSSCLRIIIVNNIQSTKSIGQNSLHYFFEFFLRMKESFDINKTLLPMKKTDSLSLIIHYLNYLVESKKECTKVEHVVSLGFEIKFLFVTSKIKKFRTVNQFVHSFLKQMSNVSYFIDAKTSEYFESDFLKLHERITMLRCLLEYYEKIPMENLSFFKKYLYIVKLVHLLESSVISKEQGGSLHSHENNIFRMIHNKDFDKIHKQILIGKNKDEERFKERDREIEKITLIKDTQNEPLNIDIINAFPTEAVNTSKKEKNTLLRVKVSEYEPFEHINKISIFNNTLDQECVDTRIHYTKQKNKQFCRDVIVGSCLWDKRNDSKEDSSSDSSNYDSDTEAKTLLKNMKKNQKFINKVNSIYDTDKKKKRKKKNRELDKKAKSLIQEVEGYLGVVPTIPLKKKEFSEKEITEEGELDSLWKDALTIDYNDSKEEQIKAKGETDLYQRKKEKDIEQTSAQNLDSLEKIINTQIPQLLKKKMESNHNVNKKYKNTNKTTLVETFSSCSSSSSSSFPSVSSSCSVDSPSTFIIPQKIDKRKSKRNKTKQLQKQSYENSKDTNPNKNYKEPKEMKRVKGDAISNRVKMNHLKKYGIWNIQKPQNWRDKNTIKKKFYNSSGSMTSFSKHRKEGMKKNNNFETSDHTDDDISNNSDDQECMSNSFNNSTRNILKENQINVHDPKKISDKNSCQHNSDLLKYHNTIQEFLKSTQLQYLRETYKEDQHELELLKRIQFAKKVLKEYNRLIKIHYNVCIDDSLLLNKALHHNSKSKKSSKHVIPLSRYDVHNWKESMKEEIPNKSLYNMNQMDACTLYEPHPSVLSVYKSNKEELKNLIRQLILELKNCTRERGVKSKEFDYFHDEKSAGSFCNHRNCSYYENRNEEGGVDTNCKQCNYLSKAHLMEEKRKLDNQFMCNECKKEKQGCSFLTDPLCNAYTENIRNAFLDENKKNGENEMRTMRMNNFPKDMGITHSMVNNSSDFVSIKKLKEKNTVGSFDQNNSSLNNKCIVECNDMKVELCDNQDEKNKKDQTHVPHFKLYVEFDGINGDATTKNIIHFENGANNEKENQQNKKEKEHSERDVKFKEILGNKKESREKERKKHSSPRRKKNKEQLTSSCEKRKMLKGKTKKSVRRMSSIVSSELKKKELAEEKEKKLRMEKEKKKKAQVSNRKVSLSKYGNSMIGKNKRKNKNIKTQETTRTCSESTPEIKNEFIDSSNDFSNNSSCEEQTVNNIEEIVQNKEWEENNLGVQKKSSENWSELKTKRSQNNLQLDKIPPVSNKSNYQELEMDFFFDNYDRLLSPSVLQRRNSEKKRFPDIRKQEQKSFQEFGKSYKNETTPSGSLFFLNPHQVSIETQQRELLFEQKKKMLEKMKKSMKILENMGRREKQKLKELLKKKKKLRVILEKYPNVQKEETETLHYAKKMSSKIENLEKTKIRKLRKIKKELERITEFCEEICENPFLYSEKKDSIKLQGTMEDTHEILTNGQKNTKRNNSLFYKHKNKKLRNNKKIGLFDDPLYDKYELSTTDSSGMDSLLLSDTSWNSFGTLVKKGRHKKRSMHPNKINNTINDNDSNCNSNSSNSTNNNNTNSFLRIKNKPNKEDSCNLNDEYVMDRIDNSKKPSLVNTNSWHTEDDIALEKIEEELKRCNDAKYFKEIFLGKSPRNLRNQLRENSKTLTKRDDNSNEFNETNHQINKSDSGEIKKYSIYYENINNVKTLEESNSSDENVESVFKTDHMNNVLMNPNENKITKMERKKKDNNSSQGNISTTPDFKKEFHCMIKKENQEYPETKKSVISSMSRASTNSKYSTCNNNSSSSSRDTPLYIEENHELQSEPTYNYLVENISESLERLKIEPSQGIRKYAIRVKKKRDKENDSSVFQRRGGYTSTNLSSLRTEKPSTDFTPFHYLPKEYKSTHTPSYKKKHTNANMNRINIKDFRLREKEFSRNRIHNNSLNKKIVHLNVRK